MSTSWETEVIGETPHWKVSRNAALRVIFLERLRERLTGVAEVDQSFDAVRRIFGMAPLNAWGIVFDMRQAIPSGDAAIEDAFRRNRQHLIKPFAKMAILLAGAVGVLQVQRMMKDAPDPRIGVFSDEESAMKWAAGGG